MKTASELTGTDLLSLDMDLNDSEQRLNILDCLRENATNMRIEQQRIRDRISAAIVQARINLYQIRKLNDELNEMKESVGSVLLLSEADQDRFLNEVEQQYAIKADEGSQQDEQLDEGQQLNNEHPVEVDQHCMRDNDVTKWSSLEEELWTNHPELQ